MRTLSLRAGRWSRWLFAAAVLFGAAATMAGSAEAATARVTWMPRGSGPVTGYAVYVRNGGSTYGASPHWSGNPTPAADGSISALVTYTPVASGANYFAVVAVSSTSGESPLSSELPTGVVNPCRIDRCTSKTTCSFVNHVNGTPCDDASFCNGPETCQNGACDATASRNCADPISCTVDSCDEAGDQCVHTGPPGCCVACESLDPCLAAACEEGNCSAEEGAEIDVNRVKFQNKASNVKLAAKGRFLADPSIDPTVTGVIFELRTVDGFPVYTSKLSGSSIKKGASPGRFRFQSSRADSPPLAKGLVRLDFRIKGSTWLVTMKAESLELIDAFLEPGLSWSVRLGDACVRHMDMACNQKATLSVCR